jgi:hypothetical protein
MQTCAYSFACWEQECSTSIGEDPLAALLAGQVQCVEYSGGRVLVDTPRRGKAVLPGSFNPLHVGRFPPFLVAYPPLRSMLLALYGTRGLVGRVQDCELHELHAEHCSCCWPNFLKCDFLPVLTYCSQGVA